ncbi:hypothetical protein H6P81_017748 [Aristolochia fimbriata]|uniref:DUF4283 domain-containing protein n=1 Tax=Aristolochia fimbriata TaxID=158543 RepID=A0AAV7E0V9_ARIFI|nr:hypothetical protein H6P81_017748 [Aristolochia fimbriata]
MPHDVEMSLSSSSHQPPPEIAAPIQEVPHRDGEIPANTITHQEPIDLVSSLAQNLLKITLSQEAMEEGLSQLQSSLLGIFVGKNPSSRTFVEKKTREFLRSVNLLDPEPEDFKVETYLFTKTAIWIRVFNLPPMHRNESALKEIMKPLGIYLCMDKDMEKRRGDRSFARIKLEINLMEPEIEYILPETSFETRVIKFNTENRPKITSCKQWGHATPECQGKAASTSKDPKPPNSRDKDEDGTSDRSNSTRKRQTTLPTSTWKYLQIKKAILDKTGSESATNTIA